MVTNINGLEDLIEHEGEKTIPWPILSDSALQGVAGEIVKLVMPYTEADQAAVLTTLIAQFGAVIGRHPYFKAGAAEHHAVIHPLICGRTSDGAKGTSLNVVSAIRRAAALDNDVAVVTGLSSAEGLIEAVGDPVGDDPEAKGYKPGVADKRLLVLESEYRQVMHRSRREGNTLAPLIRQLWDCDPVVQTLTRKTNALRSTGPHVVIIGHITPREFLSVVNDTDLSGGSINRLLICLSRRSKVNSDMGNIPDDELRRAADEFKKSVMKAKNRLLVEFTAAFWVVWHDLYPKLVLDRPDNWATEATARSVPHILRLAMLYALLDRSNVIDVEHLDAARALWNYSEQSARWLFSDERQEEDRTEIMSLANFIIDAGKKGRTRTEISVDHFKRHKTSEQISALLTPLIHDGGIREELLKVKGRSTTRYFSTRCGAN